MQKNPAQNDHFLNKTGNKKELLKFVIHVFGKLAIYLYIIEFFCRKGLSFIFYNFFGSPRARLIMYRADTVSFPMDFRILQKSQK
jgi:hypothetical protein